MRFWLDTEFQEDGHTIELISIGIVAEDGALLHLASAEYDASRASNWLRQHVLPYLVEVPLLPRSEIRDRIRALVGNERPEFWAYCGEYDWIALRQLFGSMLDWPGGWPLTCMDIEQWRLQLGAPDLPEQISPRHHALNDALWARQAWERLNVLSRRES